MSSKEKSEGPQTLEMRIAAIEDKLAQMTVTEEEMRAYRKVASLMGGGAGAAPASQTSLSCVSCLTCVVVVSPNCLSCLHCHTCAEFASPALLNITGSSVAGGPGTAGFEALGRR